MTKTFKPLTGIRVLDITLALAGPYCTLLLGGMGAEIIKIEKPGEGDMARGNQPVYGKEGVLKFQKREGDDMSLSMMNRGRNKKSIILNLQSQSGKNCFFRLVKQADVIVENFRAGTVDKLGIGWKSVKEINPRVIYCSISGFGQDGPYKMKPAFDTIAQALSGIMGATGFEDGPPMRIGATIADMTAPLYATIGILAALQYRERTGIGQLVDVAMLDSLVPMVTQEHFDAFAQHGLPVRTGNHMLRMTPMGVYDAKDGHVAICAPSDEFAFRLYEAMGRKDLLQNKHFKDPGARIVHAKEVDGLINDWTKTKTADEILKILDKYNVPSTIVISPEKMYADPQINFRKAVVPLKHPLFGEVPGVLGTGMPIKFSETPCEYDSPAPTLGQHNNEIIKELGLTDEELRLLRKERNF